jgi:hypothetical protein
MIMGVRQQMMGCLWVPILFAISLVLLMVVAAIVAAVVASSAEHAQALGRLIGIVGFPILAVVSLVVAILGTRGGWLPGTKPDSTKEAVEDQKNTGA